MTCSEVVIRSHIPMPGKGDKMAPLLRVGLIEEEPDRSRKKIQVEESKTGEY